MNYFIIDQTNPHTGEFDEHKIVIGANIKNAVEAALVYLSNYESGWQGLGAISEATPHIFDLWLKLGNRKVPFSNSDFAEKPLHLSLVGDAAPDPSKSRHWITTETGSHILINGNGDVVAGASGKLAGRKFSVPAGSKDVSKHIETVEKIAQAGYEKHGGDKAEYLRMGRNKGSSAYFAREYEKTGNIPEGHLRDALVDKPADGRVVQLEPNEAVAKKAKENYQKKVDESKPTNQPQAAKKMSEMSIEELQAAARNYDNIQNEGYSDEGQFNPYRNELRRREQQAYENAPITYVPSKPVFEYIVPDNVSIPELRGKQLKNGKHVVKDGEDFIEFKGQGIKEPGKPTTDVMLKVSGKREVEAQLEAANSAEKKRQSIFEAIKNNPEKNRIYKKAEQQLDSTSWADNTGKGAAASNAIEVLLNGGSVEEAEKALNQRRDFVD